MYIQVIWAELQIKLCFLGQTIVEKFTNLSKISFSKECFTADFLRCFGKNVHFCLLGVRVGTRH